MNDYFEHLVRFTYRDRNDSDTGVNNIGFPGGTEIIQIIARIEIYLIQFC